MGNVKYNVKYKNASYFSDYIRNDDKENKKEIRQEEKSSKMSRLNIHISELRPLTTQEEMIRSFNCSPARTRMTDCNSKVMSEFIFVNAQSQKQRERESKNTG